MIDIHTHILPGCDDGAANEAEALEAAGQALAARVDCVVATPHVIPGVYDHGREQILARVARLQAALEAAGLPLRVFPGAEYYLEPELPEKLDRGELLTLADRGRHVLVELPMVGVSPYTDQVLFNLLVRGVTPVLAHPERNRELAARPERLYRLVQRGVLVQVTAGSLTGLFGSRAQAAAALFIRQHWAHFAASDLHGPGARLTAMGEMPDRLAALVGKEAASLLLQENPRRVLEGRPVAAGTPRELETGKHWLGRLIRKNNPDA
ncbi:MAG: CpsB/CapC family capsule biosynthesis tyrosine phosphatase [Bacillota bacterium]